MTRRLIDNAFVICCWLAALVLIGAVSAILGFLVVKGAPALSLELFFGDTPPWLALTGQRQVFDGILPAVAGTLVLVVSAVGLALPAGICCGIYFAVYAPARVKHVLSLFVDILASVPSIVIGLFGLALIIVLHKHFSSAVHPSLLISAIALASLVLPYIIRSTELSIDAIDLNLRLAAQAFGASKLQNTVQVLIPRALSGILSGCILAIGRCAEDTAVIMLTGAVASAGFPDSIFGRYEAIPFFIYYTSAQYVDQPALRQGYGAAIVLLCVCSGLYLLAYTIKRRFTALADIRL